MFFRCFLVIVLIHFYVVAGYSNEFKCSQSTLESTKLCGNIPKAIQKEKETIIAANFSNTSLIGTDHVDEVRPLKIGIFSKDLEDTSRYCTKVGQVVPNYLGKYITCTARDILTTKRKKKLIEEIVPAAVQLHEERLQVYGQRETVVIPTFDSPDTLETPCGSYTIPSSHQTTGFSNYDFVLYISSAPTSMGNVIAWATTCAAVSDGRPVMGVANIVPHYIDSINGITRVVAHEIAHALGFGIYQFYLSNMVSNVSDVRGKPWSLEIISPKVLAAASVHFDYPGIRGVELEDQGGEGTAYSHWKRRNLKNELMSGIVSNTAYYTALTLAAFEDMGFYKADYSKAETMPWGYKAGADFLDTKCGTDGKTSFPDMFCMHRDGDYSCTEDRLGMGPCGIGIYLNLPSYFQYFENNILGGTANLMDYCPIVNPVQNSSCIAGQEKALKESFISESSRCLSASSLLSNDSTRIPAVCAAIECNGTSSEGTYKVKFLGSSVFVDCPEGTELSPHLYTPLFSSGAVRCPSYVSVCSFSVTFEDDTSGDPQIVSSFFTRTLRKRKLWICLVFTVLIPIFAFF